MRISPRRRAERAVVSLPERRRGDVETASVQQQGDYYEALEVARRFCNPWRENMDCPYYSDRTMYATNGYAAIAIHDVEGFGQEDDFKYVEKISSIFQAANVQRDALKRHRVDLPEFDTALRAVLRDISERSSTVLNSGFGLMQGCVRIEEQCYISAEIAQKIGALYFMFDDEDGARCAWVSGWNEMVLFKGVRWEVVTMPLFIAKVPAELRRPCADLRTGELVSVTEAK